VGLVPPNKRWRLARGRVKPLHHRGPPHTEHSRATHTEHSKAAHTGRLGEPLHRRAVPLCQHSKATHTGRRRGREAFYRPLPCEAVSPPHARRLALRTRRLALPCETADSHDAPRSIDCATGGLYPNPARALPRRRRGLYPSRRNGFTRRLYPPLTTHGAPPKFCSQA